MTTNAGASDMAKQAIDALGSGIRTGDDQEAINRLFTAWNSATASTR